MRPLATVNSLLGGSRLWTDEIHARLIYERLGVKKDFSAWIKSKIEAHDLVEDKDYTKTSVHNKNGRPKIEYILSIDAADRIVMFSRLNQKDGENI